ncbi:MAG: amino acid adenylation domain-containing protein, partial [Gordonia sp. (in: high G+C Gram-positive bacteria)]
MPITPVKPRPDTIPLSLQQWVWRDRAVAAEAGLAVTDVRVQGALDVDALHAAIVQVVTRHEILRTTFPTVDGTPVQKVGRASSVAARLDWDVLTEADEFDEDSALGIDVSRQWPVRARLLAEAPDSHVLSIALHPIAADAETVEIVMREIVECYRSEADDRDPDLEEPSLQYADYALTQAETLGGPDAPAAALTEHIAYWREALADLPAAASPLPRADADPSAVPFTVPAETAEKAAALAGELGSTPGLVVRAALLALLARLQPDRDVTIAVSSDRRSEPADASLTGPVAAATVIRTAVDATSSFGDLVALSGRIERDAAVHADVPAQIVAEALHPGRADALSRLTRVLLRVDDPRDSGERPAATAGDVRFTIERQKSADPAELTLSLRAGAEDTGWAGTLRLAAGVSHEAGAVFVTSLVELLEAAVRAADRPLADLVATEVEGFVAGASDGGASTVEYRVRDLLADVDRNALTVTGPAVEPVTLQEMFATAVEKFGPRQAVVDPGGTALTYAQLDQESTRLARWLIGRGVEAESLVALAIGRSARMLTAVWAVAKTGAAYVPIDPAYPADRIHAMVEDSGARLGLAVEASGDLPGEGFEWLRLDAPEVAAAIAEQDGTGFTAAEMPAPIRAHNTAYVIYTSGSTGRPKGVAVSHTGLANFAEEERRRSNADEYSRVLGYSSPSFDASVLEYLLATVAGGVLVYRPAEAVGGEVLQDFMSRNAVTHTLLTPTVMGTLDPASVPALRAVYAGGEALPMALKDEWALMRRIQNAYGPTEATIAVCLSEPMQPGTPVYLGGPIHGVGLAVLDGRLKPVPDGVPGELYVVGHALARGYLGRPELTAQSFVAAPYGIPGDRMYRTGDIVRWRTDAAGRRVIEYSGRSDDQVKLRGLRIELGEIESALATHPAVSAAVVVGVGGSVATALAGYVVADAETLDVAELRKYLGERLPSHMVPASITVLDALPLTPIGKLDKRALPEPVITAAEYVAPANDAERAVASAFGELLDVERVSVTESFFDLGGNSLSATRAAARVGDALGVDVTIKDVFDAPSPRALAAALSGRAAALPPVTAVEPRPDLIPLSFSQQRMWFINQYDPTLPTYNVPGVFRLHGPLDVAALRQAVADLVDRHETLRTTFPAVDGTPYQQIAPADDALAIDWAVSQSRAELEASVVTGFDVSREFPLRVRIWETGADEHVLAVVAHHIAADGESMMPLVVDLVTAYQARHSGAAPEFAPLEVQYADFAIWQREVLGSARDAGSVLGGQLAYWREQLAGLPDVLELPRDRPRPAVASQRGGSAKFVVPAEVGDRIREVARVHDVTPFIVVHAALSVLLARLSATEDIAIGTPIAGRGHADLDPLVGMFVNTLVLRADVRPSMSFAELLTELRQVDLDAFANADLPFETLIEELAPARSEAFAALAQVWLSLHQQSGPAGAVPDVAGLSLEPLEAGQSTAKVDLQVNVVVPDEGADWRGGIEFAADLFDTGTVDQFAERFVSLLDTLTDDALTPVGDAPLLGESETRRVREHELGFQVNYDDPQLQDTVIDGTLADVLPNLIARSGDGPALVADGGFEATRQQFADRVNALARKLIALGVGPDVTVGVCTPRSPEMLLSVFAVITAGGEYLPISPDTPKDRARYMLDVAGAAVLLTAKQFDVPAVQAAAAEAGLTTETVDFGEIPAGDVSPVTDSERLTPLRLDSGAYTIFTSGSTGLPKGVTVSHRAVVSLLACDEDFYAFNDRDVFLQVLDYTFDPSVLEFFRWAYDGGRLVLTAPGEHRDPWAIGSYVRRYGVTSAILVPSMLASMTEVLAGEPEAMASMRHIVTGGEALTRPVADAVLSAWPHAALHNQYGPTEATIYCTISTVRSGEGTVPIGIPTWHVNAYVLDSRLRRVPVGVPGELYISGVQLARGYAGRPNLTSERFTANPFGEPGSRMYRTGDQVRWNADGDLEYLGRTDFQVKLRGQRIEPGEIEAVLSAAPGVTHTAVLVAAAPTGGETLVGYYDGGAEPAVVADFAAERLMEYMRPTVWMPMEALPLSTAGKVDRKALPAPDFSNTGTEYVAPVTDRERALSSIIAGVLGLDRVGVTESFFALGGDSIMSIQVASLARAAGIALSPREIFERRTVRAMAAAIDEDAGRVPELEEFPGGGVGDTALPSVVRWMLELAPRPEQFADLSQSATLVAPDGLDRSTLTAVLDAVVAAHPMLAARLSAVGDEWSLELGSEFDAEAAISVHTSASPVGSAEFKDDLRAAFAEASARLDPTAGRLVAVALVQDPAGRGRIVTVVHHLGVDAVSWPILIEDLVTAGAQLAAGDPVSLRSEGTSARAWFAAIEAQASDRLDELGYWLDRAPTTPTPLGVEIDRERDTMATEVEIVHQVPAEVTEAVLSGVAEAFRGTADDVMLGALARAVRGWQAARGIDDAAPVQFLIETHGRDEGIVADRPDPRRADLTRTAGWFTVAAPIQVDPSDDVVHAVKEAKEERLGRPGGGVGYGLLRYRSDGELGARPLPSIGFNYFGAGRASAGAEVGSAEIAFAPAADGAPFPASASGAMPVLNTLSVNVSTVDDGAGRRFAARFGFASALFAQGDVHDLATRWERELAAAVDAVSTTDPGLSPSDVAGVTLSQHALDSIADRMPGAQVWPLTPLQRGLYFQSMLAADLGVEAVDVYVVQAIVTLSGELDVERLRGAAAALFEHHSVLRSAYWQTCDGEIVAVVPERVDVPWTEVYLDERDPAGVASRVDEIALAQKLTPFALDSAPLLRFVLVHHGDTSSLIVTNHHILIDGWSGPLVLADMLALYATGSPYTPKSDFGDYLRHVARGDDAAGLAAWRDLLAPLEEPSLLAPGVEATADSLPRDRHELLDAELTAELQRLGRVHGATMSTVLQAAWAVVLSRLTGARVVSFGETVSGRPADLVGADSMVGLFINTLPVVVDVDPALSAAEIIGKLQSDKVTVLDHQHVGLPELTTLTSKQTLFDTLTVYESYPVDNESLSRADSTMTGGVGITDVAASDATHYPLTLLISPAQDRLSITVKYLPAAFSDEQIDVVVDGLRRVLAAFAASPGAPTSKIALLSDERRAEVLAASTGPSREFGRTGSLGDQLASQVARTPDAIALTFGDREVTYREFGARVASTARELAAAGVGPEAAVAIAMPRSVELVVAVHAVVAAGGQYVPLDVAVPAERAHYMLETADVRVLLVSDRESVPEVVAVAQSLDVQVLGVDADTAIDLALPLVVDAEPAIGGESAAYTLFTSGSTGLPKGVTVSHRAVLNRLCWGLEAFPWAAGDKVVLKTPYTFDVSVPELFGPLIAGATVVIARQDGHLDPAYLADLINESTATSVHFVPSMLSVFLEVVDREKLAGLTSLKWLFASGEALPPATVAAAHSVWPWVQIHNLFGPTEAAVEVGWADVSDAPQTVTIGRPVANTSMLVLDARLNVVPSGVPGELYLGGVQLARGYAARPDLTADRFVADPFGQPGSRLYRTGDLVRWNGAGELEYLGRTDFQ